MSTVALAAKSTSTYAALSASAGVVVANGTTSSSTPIVVLPLTQLDSRYPNRVTSQVANTILAGPTSGTNAAPTWRLLVAADIPSLSASTITSGTIANARIPTPTTSALGGVEAASGATSHQWVSYIDTSGVQHFSQPAFSDLSGNIAVSQMNSGTGASSTTFFRGDNTWATPSGGGGGSLPLETSSDPSTVLENSAGTPILATTFSGGLSLGGAAPTVLNEPLKTPNKPQAAVLNGNDNAIVSNDTYNNPALTSDSGNSSIGFDSVGHPEIVGAAGSLLICSYSGAPGISPPGSSVGAIGFDSNGNPIIYNKNGQAIFSVDGVTETPILLNGFSGSGSFTNFTIVNGIITEAS